MLPSQSPKGNEEEYDDMGLPLLDEERSSVYPKANYRTMSDNPRVVASPRSSGLEERNEFFVHIPEPLRRNTDYSDDDIFVSARTLPASLFLVLLCILNEVQIWMKWFDDERIRYILTQSILFFVILVVYLALWYDHSRLQLSGYLNFYNQTTRISNLMFFIAAFGMCIISTLYTFWYDLAKKETSFSRKEAMDALISVETAILLITLSLYSYMVFSHNQARMPPDADVLDRLPPSLRNPSFVASPRRSADASSLIKKQADIIQYYEDRVKNLSEELVLMKKYGNDTNHGMDGAQKADLEHVVAAKDKEIRSLLVENDRLKKDIKRGQEEMEESDKLQIILQNDAADLMSEIDAHKDTITKQSQEISRLVSLLEVQRENRNSRTTDERYEMKNVAHTPHGDAL